MGALTVSGLDKGLFRGLGGPLSPLTDNRKAAVGEDHWHTGLDHGEALCGSDIGSEIELVPGNADHRDQQRDGLARTDVHLALGSQTTTPKH